MKIIDWNCDGKFRVKYRKIIDLNPDWDIMVVQECENPKKQIIQNITSGPNIIKA